MVFPEIDCSFSPILVGPITSFCAFALLSPQMQCRFEGKHTGSVVSRLLSTADFCCGGFASTQKREREREGRGKKEKMAGGGREAYRNLLKTISKHVTAKTKNPEFSAFIREEFRRHAHLKEGDDEQHSIQQKHALARDYAFLVNSVHAHKELLMSYNIAVDREAEQAARLQNTANRVGLSMPKLFEDEREPGLQQ